MLTPAIHLSEKIASGERVVGIMASDLVAPVLIEVAKKAGLDYIIVDREHGAFSDESVSEFCRVARMANYPVLIRTISSAPDVIRRTVDLGPCGLLLPNIDTTEQLDTVADCILMPPEGQRRPGGPGNYWMRDFQRETWREEFEKDFIVIPQIESLRGVENAEEIAGHAIVTALGVGPYDLSADIGCCWDPEDPEFRAALERIRDAGDRTGKKIWIGADVGRYAAEGYTFLWCGTFTSVLGSALSAIVSGAVSAEKEAPPPA